MESQDSKAPVRSPSALRRGAKTASSLLRMFLFRMPGASLGLFLVAGVVANFSHPLASLQIGDVVAGGPDVEEVFIDVPSSDDETTDPETVDAFPTLVLPEASATLQEEAVLTEFFSSPDESTIAALPQLYAPSAAVKQGTPGVVQYIVEQGDTLSTIAATFGTSTSSIMWANNMPNADYVRPGQVLRFPRVPGVLYAIKKGDTVSGIAKRFSGEEAKIISFNLLPADGTLTIGAEIVVPDGKAPAPPPPVRRVFAGSRVSNLPTVDGFFSPPTVGRRVRGITSYHRGVDIANACGTPIYAAAAGTVTRSDGTGWNGGFGKVIVIKHGNGTETLYAHLSQVIAGQGDGVGQGTLVGLMGTTGRSTGCHLHFEVHSGRNPF